MKRTSSTIDVSPASDCRLSNGAKALPNIRVISVRLPLAKIDSDVLTVLGQFNRLFKYALHLLTWSGSGGSVSLPR